MTDAPKQYRSRERIEIVEKTLEGYEIKCLDATGDTVAFTWIDKADLERDYEPVPAEQAEGGKWKTSTGGEQGYRYKLPSPPVDDRDIDVVMIEQAGDGWLPIAEAPRDGTRILVYNEMVGVYSTEWLNGEFPIFIQSGMVGNWYPVPTYWMPLSSLPKPPAREV